MKESGSISHYRILVVDDTPEVHDDFRKILCAGRESGSKLEAAESALFGRSEAPNDQSVFEVDSAFQGEHGLAKVYHALQEGRPYAMAFLDVRMPPGWNGIEVAPKLWFADPDLQIVLCTAYSDYSWETMFTRIGTTRRMFILKKPFDRMEVLQLAHNLTGKWETAHHDRQRQKHLESSLTHRNELAEKMSEKLHNEIMNLMPGKKKSD